MVKKVSEKKRLKAKMPKICERRADYLNAIVTACE